MENCLFCKIIKKEIPSFIINENDDVIVFLSLENHPLVVTKRHIENIYEMDDLTGAAVMKEAIKIAKATKTGLNTDGINLIQSNEKAAHQDVMHFHMHIKPRFHGDSVTLHWSTDKNEPDLMQQTATKIKNAL